MVSRGRVLELMKHPGFVAETDGAWDGYATYQVDGAALEVTVLKALARGRGVGTLLLAACARFARHTRLERLWLVTSNDNVDGLRFYQRRGFHLVALHRASITEARRTLKPEIPEIGEFGIPIRDELELELPRDAWDSLIEAYGL